MVKIKTKNKIDKKIVAEMTQETEKILEKQPKKIITASFDKETGEVKIEVIK